MPKKEIGMDKVISVISQTARLEFRIGEGFNCLGKLVVVDTTSGRRITRLLPPQSRTAAVNDSDEVSYELDRFEVRSMGKPTNDYSFKLTVRSPRRTRRRLGHAPA